MGKERPQWTEGNPTNPSSLRDYWKNPTRFSPDLAPQLHRRTSQRKATPSLEGQPTLFNVPPMPDRSEAGRHIQPVQEVPEQTKQAEHLFGVSQKLRERLQRRGVESLSNAELISVVLNPDHEGMPSPPVNSLLESYSVAQLLRVDFGELCEQYGLGEGKAAQLQALLEVARRLTVPEDAKYMINAPADAARPGQPHLKMYICI